MSIVHDAVADRIGDGGIDERGVPLGGGELAGEHGGGAVVAIFEDFEQVAALGVLERGDEEVVEDEHIELSELGEQAGVRSIGAGDGEFLQEPWDASVERAVSGSARGLGERGREVGLAAPRLADADDVVALLDPPAGSEVADDGLGDASPGGRPHVLHRCVSRQPGGPQQPAQPAILAGRPLAVGHQGHLLAEAALVARRLREEFLEGLGHPVEFHLLQFP